ncbi:MAG: protein kinase, partial [Planctomycetota bacterium]
RRGRSEYGTLYQGRQDALDRDVVVEVLDPDLAGDPEFVRAYQQRARSAGAFEHPGVLTVLDVVAGETTYTVYELFAGQSLAELWRNDAALERERALTVLAGIASALSHVHGRGRHHGLLTPSAVLVDAKGRVKLRGLGELPDARLRPFSRLATIRGTYASPEECRGRPSTAASDLYSLGLLACRALSGELPFQVRKLEEALALHASEDPLPLAGVDGDLDLLDLLERLLAKDPAQRPTAEHARERLEGARDRAEGVDSSTPPRLPPSARPGRPDAGRASARRGKTGSSGARRRSTGRARAKQDSARAKHDSARARKESARAAKQESPRAAKPDSAAATVPDSARAKQPEAVARTSSSAARRATSDALSRQRLADRVAPPEPGAFLYLRLGLVGLGYVLCFSAALLLAQLVRRLLSG